LPSEVASADFIDGLAVRPSLKEKKLPRKVNRLGVDRNSSNGHYHRMSVSVIAPPLNQKKAHWLNELVGFSCTNSPKWPASELRQKVLRNIELFSAVRSCGSSSMSHAWHMTS
jgi:hypothetical protein